MLVDVVVGKMTIREINREVVHYMLKAPKRMIVNIKLKEDGYHTEIWIDEETFKRRC